MEPPPLPASSFSEAVDSQTSVRSRRLSSSQTSNDSHTAAEFISDQLQLEADAREALPYKFNECTKPLGSLRQIVFACLTCNPPAANPGDSYKPAGVCYSCSIQCHGEHTLVELFNKRSFICDCGTTRLPQTSPCTLRVNPETNLKGDVHSEAPEVKNRYNQNFKNRFCGCECDYDPEMQKGTMFQCLGLGTAEEGGCGEDWWHPGCIVGLGEDWFETTSHKGTAKGSTGGLLDTITEVAEAVVEGPAETSKGEEGQHESNVTTGESAIGGPEGTTRDAADVEDDDPPLPPGFPHEDDFEGFICYKCVEANPWIKRYAGAPGFLVPVFRRSMAPSPEAGVLAKTEAMINEHIFSSQKRKADDDNDSNASTSSKRVKAEGESLPAQINGQDDKTIEPAGAIPTCRVKDLPSAPSGQLSLFFKSDFRDHLCRCSDCFPNLAKHPQLLEEEDTYEPPMSESGNEGGSTVGSGSIYDRGESALKNIDRVRAIEGVMAYNHLKEKLTPFFQQFAESGRAISAEDIKEHFAKMRGDEQAIKDAGEGAKTSDNRQEQSGY